mgnify:CR=1 FL=1
MDMRVWYLLGAVLVFFMQCGFAMVETGFTRAKNAGNIIMKNLMDFCIGTVVFFVLGYGIMNSENYFFGLIGRPEYQMFTDFANFDWSNFFFQLVFVQQQQQSFPEQWQKEQSSLHIVFIPQLSVQSYTRLKLDGYGIVQDGSQN